jgi:outer membrane murein-binding lipoprotein Lpp
MKRQFMALLIGAGVLGSFLLLGCAASTPDLIDQAHLTGDWSLVNARMEAIERREASKPKSCPRRTARVCNDRFGDDWLRCDCIENSDVRQMLRSRGY